jgi:hypothetical protein
VLDQSLVPSSWACSAALGAVRSVLANDEHLQDEDWVAIRIPHHPGQPPGAQIGAYAIDLIQDTWRIQASTPEEAVGLLIDGYADLPDEGARLDARTALAKTARSMVQDLLNAGEHLERSSEAEISALLDRSGAPLRSLTSWRSPIPLVLVATDFAPRGSLAQPTVAPPGQIWWIDPSSAATLLRSLHEVRWLDLSLDASRSEPWSNDTPYRNQGDNGSAGYRWRSITE